MTKYIIYLKKINKKGVEALPDHQEGCLICIVVKSLSGMYCIVRLSNNQLFTLPIKKV